MHSPVVAVRARGLPFLLYCTRFRDNITPVIAKDQHRFDISSNPFDYLAIKSVLKPAVTTTTMKTNTTFKPGPLSRALFPLLLGATAIWVMPATTRGQIFVTNAGNGTIGKYSTSGATVTASLISGLNRPAGIAVLGGDLFVTNFGGTSIGEYTTSGATVKAALVSGLDYSTGIAVSGGNLFVNSYFGGTTGEYTTAGATVNASLISGLNFPQGIAVSGENLFVTNVGDHSIGEYTTSGATVNAALITGLNYPSGIAVSGGNLFVVNFGAGTIGEYTTLGATVNASLVSGLSQPEYIAVSGGNLFVTSYNNGTIGEYTMSGATVNASLISGLNGPEGIAVVSVPPVVWTGTSSTNWADSGNWSGAVPGATAGTTNGDTAAFNQNAPQSPSTIDAGRNIWGITFDTANVNSLTVGAVGGQALLLTAGGAIQTSSTVINPQTIDAPLELEGGYTFISDASMSSATLSFGGRISPGATSGVTTLSLNGSNTGANTISGVLADNGAGQLAVTISGPGVWILSGANTYSGNTTVNGGTLQLAGGSTNNVPKSPSINVGSGATLDVTGLAGSTLILGSGNVAQALSGRGTVAGSVAVNGGIANGTGSAPAGSAVAGGSGATLTITGGVVLQNGSVSNFTLGALNGSGNPLTAFVNVMGAAGLTVNGTHTLNLSGAAHVGTYELYAFTTGTPLVTQFSIGTAAGNFRYAFNVIPNGGLLSRICG